MSILRCGFALSVLLVAAGCPAAFGQTGAYPLLQPQGAKLVGTGATGSAQQGQAVALSADGNTAILGGPADNSSIGGAWIFTRSAGVWTQQGGELIGTGATGIAQQGTSVAISGDGNTAIIGGPADNSGAGAAWIFKRSSGTWGQQGSKLVGTGATGAAGQGISVAISADGNNAIIGGNSDSSSAGAAWIFTRSSEGVWSQQGSKLTGTGATGAAQQGSAVAISGDGNTALIGGPANNSGAGAFWVFTRSSGTWTQLGAKLVGTGGTGSSSQGQALALSADGQVAAIGGPADSSGAGAVWIFTLSGGTWTQRSAITASFTDASASAQLGSSMAISGDGAVILSGGAGDSSQQGAVFMFGRTGRGRMGGTRPQDRTRERNHNGEGRLRRGHFGRWEHRDYRRVFRY